MSAEVENPYFVDSQFQSDNRITHWWKRQTGKVINPVTALPADRNRIKHKPMFALLCKLKKQWSHEFDKAEKTSYECYYMKDNNILYHGWSQLKNDKIPMSALSQNDPYFHASRTCYMHEMGLPNSPMLKMLVPIHNENVLWRKRDV